MAAEKAPKKGIKPRATTITNPAIWTCSTGFLRTRFQVTKSVYRGVSAQLIKINGLARIKKIKPNAISLEE